MGRTVFVKRSRIEASAERVFAWHAEPGALERLTPPWERVEVVERSGDGIRPGARIVLETRLGPFRLRWVAEHTEYIEGRRFRDVQRSGPFAHWEHTHSMEPEGPNACWLEDRIEYALRFGSLGGFLAGWMVRRRLERLFAYRHEVTRKALERRTP